ncbi:hypothetical protein BH24CHL6_BH24CHL6_16730 [soil metagenome]
MASELSNLGGTEWVGTGELWLDPLGNEAQLYECTLSVGASCFPMSANFAWRCRL